MAEIQKYNLLEKLREADEKYKGDPALVGSSGMTFAAYNNSTRTNMTTSQMNQFLNITNPEFPYVFTGMENVAGRNSSGYKQLDGDVKIYKKVVKFENLVDRPYVYQLFFWDYEKNRYDVIERKEIENLGQDFGYMYNNTFIDGLKEGDEVSKGVILYRSRSYDESMNYRYGKNILSGYTFDPFEYEDASTIAEYVHRSVVSLSTTKKKLGINTGDLPLNAFGNDDEYRPLPWIGETVDGIVGSVRPYIISQKLHDAKHSNLQCITDTDRTIYGTGTIIDYTIYLNDPNWYKDDFTAQIWMLIDSHNRYWKKVQDVCLDIKASGKDYTHAVDLLYKKSRDFLERRTNYKWFNGSSAFDCIEIYPQIVDFSPLSEGGKFTARYGNKTVVARVLPDYMMPFTAEGEHLGILLAVPAVPNRTTGYVPHELHITWLFRCARKALKQCKTLKEKEDIAWDLINRLNKHQYEFMYNEYLSLPKEEREKYIDSMMNIGMFSHQDVVNEDGNIFFKLMAAEDELPYAKPETLYNYRFGHVYRLYQKFYLGSLYVLPLKQTDTRGFSVRSTGAINLKGLPERSYKNKRGEAPFSDTAIRFGEYEALTMLIGLSPEEFTAMEAVYRTSPEASKALTRAQFDEACKEAYEEWYTSRPAEIINIFFRHLGVEPHFIDTDNEIKTLDSKAIRTHELNGVTYLCTDLAFHEICIKDRIKRMILLENPVIIKSELDRLVDEIYKEVGIVSKQYDGHDGYHETIVDVESVSVTPIPDVTVE